MPFLIPLCRHDARLVVEVGGADEAGVSERHRLVAIAANELAERGEFALDGEGDVEHAAFDQGQDRFDHTLGR